MKPQKTRLAGAELKKLVESRLIYSPQSGLFRWANGPRKGMLAGSISDSGYRMIHLAGKNYRAHRLAHLIHYGFEPIEVDHINQDKLDNRICNLQAVTRTENQLNRVWAKRELPRGVVHCGKKYKAQITIGGKCIYIGLFISADAAGEAYQAAKMERRAQ
jgi:hypothetical protein